MFINGNKGTICNLIGTDNNLNHVYVSAFKIVI
jgi:hypothetical protein